MFFKIGALKNCAVFTGRKHLLESLGVKTSVFLCEYCKNLRATFFISRNTALQLKNDENIPQRNTLDEVDILI